MAKIIAPNSNYCGTSAGVVFNKGVGSTDNPYLIDWFKNHGYTVKEETPEAENGTPPDILDGMTAEELIVFAEENKIDIGKSTSKEGILKKIRTVGQQENPEGDADGSEG